MGGSGVWPGRRQRLQVLEPVVPSSHFRGHPMQVTVTRIVRKPPAVEPQDLPRQGRRGERRPEHVQRFRTPCAPAPLPGAPGGRGRHCNHGNGTKQTPAPGFCAGAARPPGSGKSCEHPPSRALRQTRFLPVQPRQGVESRVQGWGTKKRQRADSFVPFPFSALPSLAFLLPAMLRFSPL